MTEGGTRGLKFSLSILCCSCDCDRYFITSVIDHASRASVLLSISTRESDLRLCFHSIGLCSIKLFERALNNICIPCLRIWRCRECREIADCHGIETALVLCRNYVVRMSLMADELRDP